MSPVGDGGVSVVLARPVAPGESLLAALGPARVAGLRALTLRRAREWAGTVCPGAAVRELDGELGEVAAALLAGGGGSAAAGEAGGGGDGDADTPVTLVIAPELAVWRPQTGAAALEDLAAGCALSFGPVFDGGLYLLAISATARAPLGAMRRERPGRRVSMGALIEIAAEAGLEVGMVRSERSLRHAEDRRALLADPLIDDELRGALR